MNLQHCCKFTSSFDFRGKITCKCKKRKLWWAREPQLITVLRFAWNLPKQKIPLANCVDYNRCTADRIPIRISLPNEMKTETCEKLFNHRQWLQKRDRNDPVFLPFITWWFMDHQRDDVDPHKPRKLTQWVPIVIRIVRQLFETQDSGNSFKPLTVINTKFD